MRTAVASGQWLVVSEASICGGSEIFAVRHRFIDSSPSANSLLSATDGRLPTNGGGILIALLWILTALSVIALSFSKECFVEVAAARNAQSLETSYFAARAGISAALYQLRLKKQSATIQSANSQDTVDSLDLGYTTGNFGGAEYRVEIQDESGKINLNSVPESQLRLLVEACGIPKPDSDIITDSTMDWRTSASAQPHTNGAKDDYYQTLNPPYKCKSGNFDTVEELLLVRGVTADYFYGHPERAQDGSIFYKYGLSRCLTAYTSGGNSINVNSAPLPVLLSAGLSPEAAKTIYEKRHVKPYKNLTELISEFPTLGAQGVNSLNTVTILNSAGIYTLIASAHAENSKARRVIRAVINNNAAAGQRTIYRTLYWNENIPDYEGYTQ
jgi:general secretion pathway protein K